MDQTAKFWDKAAERYSRQPIADEAAYQKKLQITRSYFCPDMELLELGCGTGSTALLHAPYVRHIRAVDVSGKMLDIARSKAAAEHIDNISFEQSEIGELPVSDGTYDIVLALSILHLLEDREAVIAKVFRMLKPGGLFVSSTACLGDHMKYFKLIAPVGKFLGLMPLLKVFTAKELADSLSAAGFALEHFWQPGKGNTAFIVAKKAG